MEFLSFFNQYEESMKKYDVYQVFVDHFSEFLEKIIESKCSTKKKHKETAYILFKAETDLMSLCVSKCLDQGISPLYTYDALWIAKSDQKAVVDIMNESARDLMVPTVAI